MAFTTLARFGRQIPAAVRDELAQETLLRVLPLVELARPLAMVRRIARNLAIDHLRRRRADPATPEIERVLDTRWADRVHARMELERAVRALDRAPGAYRRLLTALVLEERGMDELIAREAAIGGSVARARETVYRRRGRAFAWMRENVER